MPLDTAPCCPGVTQEQYNAAPRIFAISPTVREVRHYGPIGFEVMGIMVLDAKSGTVTANRHDKLPFAFRQQQNAGPAWRLAYEVITGLDFMPWLVDVSEVKAGWPDLKFNRKTQMCGATARDFAKLGSGAPSITILRAVASDIPDCREIPFSAALGKDFRDYTAQEYSDLIYANAWCKAWGKSMFDYLSAGFYGAPQHAEQMALAA
jgi:hypothetical protein